MHLPTRLIAPLLAPILAAALALPAGAFITDVRLDISPGPGSDFTVEFDVRAKLTDYWCAAGNYVTNTMGLPDKTRVYRLSPPPRKQGQGIVFTLDPARSSGETGITTFGGPQDGSMSAGGAVAQFCYVFDEEFF